MQNNIMLSDGSVAPALWLPLEFDAGFLVPEGALLGCYPVFGAVMEEICSAFFSLLPEGKGL